MSKATPYPTCLFDFAGMRTIGEYLPISSGHSGCILLTCYAEKHVDDERNVVHFWKVGILDVLGELHDYFLGW